MVLLSERWTPSGLPVNSAYTYAQKNISSFQIAWTFALEFKNIKLVSGLGQVSIFAVCPLVFLIVNYGKYQNVNEFFRFLSEK